MRNQLFGLDLVDGYEFIHNMVTVKVQPYTNYVIVPKMIRFNNGVTFSPATWMFAPQSTVTSETYNLYPMNTKDTLKFKYQEFFSMTDRFRKVKMLDKDDIRTYMHEYLRDHGNTPDIIQFDNDYIIAETRDFRFYTNGYEGRLLYNGERKPVYLKTHFEPMECEELELLEMGYNKKVDINW